MIEALFLTAPLLAVPLALRLIPVPRIFLWIQPGAAALTVVSFLFPPGLLAAILAAPWFLFTAALALTRQPSWNFKLAVLFIPVGGAWLVISRAGMQPLGFTEPIVLLTAVHFHFAGFVSPILAGLVRPPRIVQVGVLLGPPLLAAGITLSPTLELAAAIGLAISVGATGFRQLRHRSILLWVSSFSAMAGMILAVLYAFRILDIPTMARWHGVLLSLGFGICGLLGWQQKTRTPAE